MPQHRIWSERSLSLNGIGSELHKYWAVLNNLILGLSKPFKFHRKETLEKNTKKRRILVFRSKMSHQVAV